MDLTSLYYFSELAKELHMTWTADRLFISQQTLSNHIQRLKDYYGTKLLHRKPSLSLTTAGEFVLGFAEVINKEKSLQGADVKDFSELPFCIFENRMGRQINQRFDAANIVPRT